jgi:Nif-specific regulatory protein
MASQVAELTLLFEISQILDRSMDLREVVGPVLEAMSLHLGMVRGTLTLLDRQTGEISIDVAHGLSESQKERGRYRLGEGITGKVVATGRPAVVARVSEEPRFLNRTGARNGLHKKDVAFICAPITIGHEVIGALSADHIFPEELSLDEGVRVLSIIASMISRAVQLRQSVQEERRRLVEENQRLQDELQQKFNPANIIGNSKRMRDVYDQIAHVRRSSTTVLIHGESGTGKELVAHAIHYNSARAGKPFIRVNCAALPETLVESELFGHEKGAFTGAIAERQGRFEAANGGTIFLDEVGDLSAGTQVKLLRVLQEREFERVGGSAPIKIDVRVVAATNRPLEKMITEGTFRQDLYYRLNVFPITLPPLRERKADILLLSDFFVEKYSKANHKSVKRISTSAIDLLMGYHWPGNVRELENCIERAVLVSSDNVIQGSHFPATLQSAEASGAAGAGPLQATLDNVERELIIEALRSTRGNMAKASRVLGMTERLMGIRVRKHSIDPARYREGHVEASPPSVL